jgi:hypothetical protein
MLRQANNVFSVLVNDVDVATSTLPTVGTVITDANLPKGAVVLVDAGLRRMSNTEYAALANGDQFMVVQGKGTGNPLMKSPVLTKGSTKFTIAKHKAAVQQVTTIGYNGTTGSLPTASNTDFWIKVRKRDNDAANRSQPMSLFAGPVRTDATGNQAELACLLALSGNQNFKNEPANGYLKFDLLCSNAGTEALGAADTIVATEGSRKIVITESGGVLPYLFAVGDFIRLGTATTDPVYKITATTVTVADGGTLTVDRPVTASFAPTAGTGTTEYITASDAASANFGIVLTGKAAPFNVNSFRDYYANRFTATFSDATVLVTATTGARNGNGVWQQVAMDEYMSYGFEGQNDMLGVPPALRDQVVKIPGVGSVTASTAKYSALDIAWTENINGLVTTAGAQGNVLVYLNLDSSGDLDTSTANNGETFVVALGLTAADFDE